MINLLSEIETYRKEINDYMESYIDSKRSILDDEFKYVLLDGGKRVRPFLCRESFKLFESDIKEYNIKFEVAIELIHTYSLIHDDLPCMDNDDFRRGKLSAHKKYGEDIAVLLGDSLLNLAFELISEALYFFEDDKGLKSFSKLSYASGTGGMIGGQLIDIRENNRAKIDDLIYMYTLKTAKLFEASCEIGASLSGASSKDIKHLKEFGKNLGLSYQIADDIIDYQEDKISNKKTIATCFGIDIATEYKNRFTNLAKENLSRISSGNKNILNELLDRLDERED